MLATYIDDNFSYVIISTYFLYPLIVSLFKSVNKKGSFSHFAKENSKEITFINNDNWGAKKKALKLKYPLIKILKKKDIGDTNALFHAFSNHQKKKTFILYFFVHFNKENYIFD